MKSSRIMILNLYLPLQLLVTIYSPSAVSQHSILLAAVVLLPSFQEVLSLYSSVSSLSLSVLFPSVIITVEVQSTAALALSPSLRAHSLTVNHPVWVVQFLQHQALRLLLCPFVLLFVVKLCTGVE